MKRVGYPISHTYSVAFDNPGLVVACSLATAKRRQ